MGTGAAFAEFHILFGVRFHLLGLGKLGSKGYEYALEISFEEDDLLKLQYL
jgi:hypothetical protein